MEKFPNAMIEVIQRCTAEHFGITREELLEKGRERQHVVARRIMMFLAWRFTQMSLASLGKAFGMKCHSVVKNARDVALDQMLHDPRFAASVVAIEASCRVLFGFRSCCIMLWSEETGALESPMSNEDFKIFHELAVTRGIKFSS